MDAVKVLLVDDHAMLRDSLALALSGSDGIEVIGSAADAGAALALLDKLSPDVVLMDVDMPGMACFDAVKRLSILKPSLKTLFLSAFFNDRYIEQALAAGAKGYITKHEPKELLVKAIRQVARGGVYFSEQIMSRLIVDVKGVRLPQPSGSRLSTLTAREIEVLRYLAAGLSKKEVAAAMHVSIKTVDTHAMNIMRKLDIHDRVELARFAIREGIVEG